MKKDEELVTFTTYRCADGLPILGLYAFVTSLDGLEYEECDIIEEIWALRKANVIDFNDEFDSYYDFEPPKVLKFREE